MMTKCCSDCKQDKPSYEFSKDRIKPDGLQSVCKTCHKTRHRSWHLNRYYGLTTEQYDSLVIDQAGTCAICTGPETMRDPNSGEVIPLSVDHCHKTGRVRGLLCRSCNTSIGKFKEDPSILRRAALYLEGS